jgi:prepilin-type N-terminal cleavage/methylation domain-containing protein
MFRNLARRRQRGFTLIELLIVVAIIGIIASILVPNLIDALQKAKQKRTLATMRNIGTAWMSWLTDQVSASAAGASVYDASDLDRLTFAKLENYLIPSTKMFYASAVPEFDGWTHRLEYCVNSDLIQQSAIMICSPGRNGQLGENPTNVMDCCNEIWASGSFIGTDYDQDIVWADGFMVRSPISNSAIATP